MNTNEVDTRDIAEISTDISEWVVAQQKRRTPEFLRIGVLASEGELVEMPSYDNLYGVARRLDLRVRPDQAYKLAQMIIEAVEGGLGEMESDRVQLHIEMPERLQHEVVPSVAQCTPHRNPYTTYYRNSNRLAGEDGMVERMMRFSPNIFDSADLGGQ